MGSTDWNKVNRIFNAALRRDPADRTAFVYSECGGNAALREEIESLLSSYVQADSFLEDPAISEVAGSFVSENTRLEDGEEFGRYRIKRLIGKGGMGEVYLAEDHQLHRDVAIKTLPLRFGFETDRLERFEFEAFAVSSLNHPNILTIHEIGEHDGIHFISTEYVDGKPLLEYCHNKKCRLTDILDIFTQLLSGLSAAHDAGIVHRDIKPENLMIRDDGYLKILDFGVAKLKGKPTAQEAGRYAEEGLRNITDDGLVLGTASYMSPEQARGASIDERSDVWSVGMVLYELITGENPFACDTPADTIAAILHKKLPPISGIGKNVPVEMEEVVGKALQKDVEDRFQNAREFGDALEAIRHKIEFEEELERSGIPNAPEESTKLPGRDTDEGKAGRTITSSGFAFGGFRSRGISAAAFIAAILIGLTAAGYYIFRDSSPVFTDKDVILLTDFENRTGEEIFGGTLEQGLMMSLQQSPFLSIFPDAQARATLKAMKRDPNGHITKELAMEICQRNSLKAFVSSSLSRLGGKYVLGLEAVNSRTGETFVSVQKQGEASDQKIVLDLISEAATEIRVRLGESLAQIEKFDKPLSQSTTSSLEALRAFTEGHNALRRGEGRLAVSQFERAIELDPEFASAYGALSAAYGNIGESELAREAAREAYERRNRGSEIERLNLAAVYYAIAEYDSLRAIEVYETLKASFPRLPTNNLGVEYSIIGDVEKSLSNREVLLERITEKRGCCLVVSNLFWIYLQLGQKEKAKQMLKILEEWQHADAQADRFALAFMDNDEEEVERLFEAVGGKPEIKRAVAQARGKWKEVRALTLAKASSDDENQEPRSIFVAQSALVASAFKKCSDSRELAIRSIETTKSISVFRDTALALANCGEHLEARQILTKLNEKYPEATIVNFMTTPAVKAVIALNSGKAEEAIAELEPARKYERSVTIDFWIPYLRAKALFQLGRLKDAGAEYEKILRYPGEKLYSPLKPLAQLGKARATGDKAEYEKFFEMWKYADDDIPELVAARKEYLELNSRTTGSTRDEATPLPSANPRPPWSWIF